MINVIIAEIICIITALRLCPINLLIFKFCLIHLKNNSISQRFLYNHAISSLVYSNILVTKVNILPSESSTLITLYWFLVKLMPFVPRLQIISSMIFIESSSKVISEYVILQLGVRIKKVQEKLRKFLISFRINIRDGGT
nr:hypothetical protein [Clostridium pasteurianum]